MQQVDASFALSDVSFGYSTRRKPVLAGMNWQVSGGVTALLGPNGAGKSTTLKLLCGLLRPASGTVQVSGRPVNSRSRLGPSVGYLPQDPPAIGGFNVREQVAYSGWLSGLTRRAAATATHDALERTNLTGEAQQATTALSGGQRRRLGIACAVVHDPHLVLLDEPTAGLDPIERQNVEELMRTAITAKTVIASTQEVDNISDVFDAVAICYSGQILSSQPLKDYRRVTGAPTTEAIDWRQTYRLIVDRATS